MEAATRRKTYACASLLVAFDAIRAHHTDVLHIAIDLVVVEAITDDKLVGDAEPGEIGHETYALWRALLQQGRNAHGSRAERLNVRYELAH
eukprot:CAMPEP_0174734412 /NCGR_PEP_ID=MMETSP1094-20130205/63250_1 /TAXON_ID=156173 /ORGANISM="Chrysochromulina brevifilum, Strain UTEX LB 985" /LENGTH=90 /DNA_ID=CAMNT_0015937221 /DNA_START=224 /DNA_END=493 /DNA_ORIENTATION=+